MGLPGAWFPSGATLVRGWGPWLVAWFDLVRGRLRHCASLYLWVPADECLGLSSQVGGIMKFKCLTEECSHKFQSIELRAEQLIPLKLDIKTYEREGTPFFYTIPPVYCGYCGKSAQQVLE